jgi:hypothetical protein
VSKTTEQIARIAKVQKIVNRFHEIYDGATDSPGAGRQMEIAAEDVGLGDQDDLIEEACDILFAQSRKFAGV